MSLKEQLNPDLVYNPNDDGCLNISDEEDDDDDEDEEDDEDDSVVDYGTTDEDFKNQLREKTKKLSATDSCTFSGPDSDDEEMSRIYKFCNSIVKRLVDKVCDYDSKGDFLISCDEEEEEDEDEEGDDDLKDESILKDDGVVMGGDNDDHDENIDSSKIDVKYNDNAELKGILVRQNSNDDVQASNDVTNNNDHDDEKARDKNDEAINCDAHDNECVGEHKEDSSKRETTSIKVTQIKSPLEDDKIANFKDKDLIVEEKNDGVNNNEKMFYDTSV